MWVVSPVGRVSWCRASVSWILAGSVITVSNTVFYFVISDWAEVITSVRLVVNTTSGWGFEGQSD